MTPRVVAFRTTPPIGGLSRFSVLAFQVRNAMQITSCSSMQSFEDALLMTAKTESSCRVMKPTVNRSNFVSGRSVSG